MSGLCLGEEAGIGVGAGGVGAKYQAGIEIGVEARVEADQPHGRQVVHEMQISLGS